MPLIEWKEEFSVGRNTVDHEHRELIELINRLHDHVREPGGEMQVSEFLGEIFAAISGHFALEEREMRDARYAEYPAHKEDHERLLDELRDMMDDYEENSEFDEDGLGRSLSEWFGIHFRTHDAKLHQKLG